jgi:hypothetical protein
MNKKRKLVHTNKRVDKKKIEKLFNFQHSLKVFVNKKTFSYY